MVTGFYNIKSIITSMKACQVIDHRIYYFKITGPAPQSAIQWTKYQDEPHMLSLVVTSKVTAPPDAHRWGKW